MLNLKDWDDEIQDEGFEEHPIEDSRNWPCHIFSVNNIGYLDSPPDFMQHGSFDLDQYSVCLIKTVFTLPHHLLSPFFDYQCNQLKKPFRWLVSLDFFITYGEGYKFIMAHSKRAKMLEQLIKEKKLLWKAYVENTSPVNIFSAAPIQEFRRKYNIDLVMQEMRNMQFDKDKRKFLEDRMEAYLNEVEWDEESAFAVMINKELEFIGKYTSPPKKPIIKDQKGRTLFYGLDIDLANYYNEYRHLLDRDGKLMCKDSTNHFADLICNGYVKPNGSSFDRKSILNHLENYDKSKGRFWDLKSTLNKA